MTFKQSRIHTSLGLFLFQPPFCYVFLTAINSIAQPLTSFKQLLKAFCLMDLIKDVSSSPYIAQGHGTHL